jgi:hypothetical protein
MLYLTPAKQTKMSIENMNKAAIAFALLLAGISAAQAAPIKAKYCVAVAVTSDAKQEKQLTGLVAQFAGAHALKQLSHQAANTDAYRSADSTIEVAVTTEVGGLGAVLFMFDTNQPVGPISGQLASYVKRKVAPLFKVTKCSDIEGFKTPEIN